MTRTHPTRWLQRGDDRVTDEDWSRLFRDSYDTTIRDARVQASLEEAFRRAASGAPRAPRIRSKCLTDPRAKHENQKNAYWPHYELHGTPSTATFCTCACHAHGSERSGGAEHPDHPVYGRICPGKYADVVRLDAA